MGATELTVTIFRYVFDDEAPTARAVVYAVRSNLMHSQNTCFRSIRTQCAESSSKPLLVHLTYFLLAQTNAERMDAKISIPIDIRDILLMYSLQVNTDTKATLTISTIRNSSSTIANKKEYRFQRVIFGKF